MRLLIRDNATGDYLQQDSSSWGKACSALHFHDLRDLVHFIQRNDSETIELVLSVLNKPSKHDITIDLRTLNQSFKKDNVA